MLRRLYGWIIRLHPRRFRDRFGPEMLSIFDESRAHQATARLLADSAVSLVRQWVLRSGSGIAETDEAVPWSSDGSPVFYILDDYRPRTGSLITGGMLTVVVFCATWLVAEYTWTHPVFMPLITVQFDAQSDLKTSEQSPPSPLPLQATASSPNEMTSARSRTRSVPNSSETSPVALSNRNPSVSQPSIAAPVITIKDSATFTTASGMSRTTKPAATPSVQLSGKAVSVPAASENTLVSYTGLYATEPPNALDIEVTVEDGRLSIQIAGEPKTTLAPLGGTDFMFSDSESDLIEFIKHSHGPADLVIYRNGRTLTAHRARPHNR